MNLYAFEKTNRILSIFNNWEMPASWFQSINPLLIILLGMPISAFWIKRKFSSLFKMSLGIMIMGFGFIFMYFSSLEFNKYGISSMHWLFLAYFFHTVGQGLPLCLRNPRRPRWHACWRSALRSSPYCFLAK